MFRASSCPSSGATTTTVAASGLPSELDDSILNKYLAFITFNKLVYSYLYVTVLSDCVHCDIDDKFIYFHELLI
jgi:hypothetical protein